MKTAIIIGAGPAGLTAAYELASKGAGAWQVIVLEESPYIGGLSRTAVHGKCRLDIGGHRFFSKSAEVNALWKKLLPVQGAPARDDILLGRPCNTADGGPDPEKTDAVMLRRRRISRIFYLRHFFDYPVSVKFSTIAAMGPLRTLKAACSYIASIFVKRKENSLEDFYINRFGRVLYSMFFEDYTEKLWGIHPSRISPEWGAQRVKGLSLGKAILNIFKRKGAKKETSLIDEFLYPKFGPGQLWERLAAEAAVMGADIRLNTKVTEVLTDNGLVSGVKTATGEIIRCDALFSSMPVKDLAAAFQDVPEGVGAIAGNLPYRDFMTAGLLVDRLAIKNTTKLPTVAGIVPDTWIYIQERNVRIGRLQIFNNWSPYMVDDISSHVWLGLEYFCDEGDDLWSMDDEAFSQFAASELRSIGILDAETAVLDSAVLRVRKAYPAYFGAYSEFEKVREWLDDYSNLYCIGRNGQHRYNNMDHSMLCGIEAVKSLLSGSDKAAVWNVNTEEQYHETK